MTKGIGGDAGAAAPAELDLSDLDQVDGGVLIGLLLPAVQKMPETGGLKANASAASSTHPGGCNFAMGDGSVRF